MGGKRAWAIEAKLWPEKPMVMLGVGWFGWPKEEHLQGCRTALFATRVIARARAADIRRRNQIATRVTGVEILIRSNDAR